MNLGVIENIGLAEELPKDKLDLATFEKLAKPNKYLGKLKSKVMKAIKKD